MADNPVAVESNVHNIQNMSGVNYRLAHDPDPWVGFNAYTAQNVYKPVSERSKEVNGYLLDEALSDEHHSVYANKVNSKKTHIAVRGSAEIKDWTRNNTLITVGLEDPYAPRWQKANTKLIETKSKYGSKHSDMSLSGHSLAGAITVGMSAKHGIEGHAFSPGSTGVHAFKNAMCSVSNSRRCEMQKKHLHVYAVRQDPVSLGWIASNSTSAKRIVKINWHKGAHPHSMDNYLTEF